MYRFKGFVCTLLAVMIGIGCCGLVKAAHLSRFADIDGTRTYFLDSASSQGLQKNTLSFLDVARVKGECVRTEISAYAGGRTLSKEEIAEEITRKYKANVLFYEEVDGILSYYAYVADWADGIWLYGQKVNLHVAVGETYLSVGTPIIFGGY